MTETSRRAFIGVTLAAALGLVGGMTRPAFSQQAELNPQLPTLFVVGDSTARNNANGARGWGEELAPFFDLTKINVANRAMAGRSSRTFIIEGRWERVLQEMKRGDIVLIQFGHNDTGPLDTGRARGSLPGTGEEKQEIKRPPDGTPETVLTYGAYLRKMIADTADKGATPILLSLTVRNLWKDGKVERGSGRFREWAMEVATARRVPFLDLTNLVADQYEQLGEEKVKPLFGPDYVHTSPAGAALNASIVVTGLLRLGPPAVTAYLSEKGKSQGR